MLCVQWLPWHQTISLGVAGKIGTHLLSSCWSWFIVSFPFPHKSLFITHAEQYLEFNLNPSAWQMVTEGRLIFHKWQPWRVLHRFYILSLLLIVLKETIFLFILTFNITFPRPQFKFVRYRYYKGPLMDNQFMVNSLKKKLTNNNKKGNTVNTYT